MSMRYKGGVISATAPTTSGTPNTGVATGIWTLQQQMQAQGASLWPNYVLMGQQAYTTAGTYSWVAPAGVTSVSVVVVGSGYSAYGGALSYKNNITVIPGNSYTVVVKAADPNDSYFISSGTVSASFNQRTGDGGGNGGTAGNRGGGGAGGYSGTGGTGGGNNGNGGDGSGGGGGGGGGYDYSLIGGGGGGGVGLLGQGSSGTGGTFVTGTSATGGTGGSGGSNGGNATGNFGAGDPGLYGGAGPGLGGFGGSGAVRIIWPGTTRFFPSTNTGDM